MFRTLVGFAVGYVLGARAGRARYDQIAALVQRVADHPAVQGAAGFLHAKASGLLHTGPTVRRPDAADLDRADPEPNTSVGPGDRDLGQRPDPARRVRQTAGSDRSTAGHTVP